MAGRRRCVTTGKLCYDRERVALQAKARLDPKLGCEHSAYLCLDCWSWHLTNDRWRRAFEALVGEGEEGGLR